ncbi:uncharacterized protein LOC110520528 [Oncorhynchus mykiss]|uniref:uncharacterized protein LOC110520528 n=1 Tax=Oncorhynchus mykiss TaxID=8022 RepID=UPI0018787041|nr:uncharacterized protein LOC110520528 [Oncorhynchus mykiss]
MKRTNERTDFDGNEPSRFLSCYRDGLLDHLKVILDRPPHMWKLCIPGPLSAQCERPDLCIPGPLSAQCERSDLCIPGPLSAQCERSDLCIPGPLLAQCERPDKEAGIAICLPRQS